MMDLFKEALFNLYLPSFSEVERQDILNGKVSARELIASKKRTIPFGKETVSFLLKIKKAYGSSVAIEAVRRFSSKFKEKENLKTIRNLWILTEENELVYKFLYLSFLAHATGFHLMPEFSRYRGVLNRLEEEKFLNYYVFYFYKELSSYMWKCYFSERERTSLYPRSRREYVAFEFLMDYFPSFVEEEEELERKALDEELLLLIGEEEGQRGLTDNQISQLTAWVKNQLEVIRENEKSEYTKRSKLRDLEKQLSLSRGYLTRFLSGKENMSLQRLLKLAHLLGCDFPSLGIPLSVLKGVEL